MESPRTPQLESWKLVYSRSLARNFIFRSPVRAYPMHLRCESLWILPAGAKGRAGNRDVRGEGCMVGMWDCLVCLWDGMVTSTLVARKVSGRAPVSNPLSLSPSTWGLSPPLASPTAGLVVLASTVSLRIGTRSLHLFARRSNSHAWPHLPRARARKSCHVNPPSQHFRLAWAEYTGPPRHPAEHRGIGQKRPWQA